MEQYETSLANKLDINAGDSVYYDCATKERYYGADVFHDDAVVTYDVFVQWMYVCGTGVHWSGKGAGYHSDITGDTHEEKFPGSGKSVFLKYHSASGRLFQFYRNFCGIAENDGRRTDRRGFLGVRTYGLCDAASDHSVNGHGLWYP